MNIAYITELTDINYKETIQNNELVLVDIFTDWCQPCKTLSPIIDQIATEMGDKLLVGKLDADANKETLSELGVRNIPTVLIYKKGIIVEKSVGMSTKQKLMELINKHI